MSGYVYVFGLFTLYLVYDEAGGICSFVYTSISTSTDIPAKLQSIPADLQIIPANLL